MEAPEQTTLDFSTVPHVFGVPRYLYRKALAAAAAWVRAMFAARSVQAFEHELWLCFFAGILRQLAIAGGKGLRARRTPSRPQPA
jgi:hypothetical protein